MKACILLMCINSVSFGGYQIKDDHDLVGGILTIVLSIVVGVAFSTNQRLSWFSGKIK
jgi:hypothetical protein